MHTMTMLSNHRTRHQFPFDVGNPRSTEFNNAQSITLGNSVVVKAKIWIWPFVDVIETSRMVLAVKNQ
jgi:hypothetical protein